MTLTTIRTHLRAGWEIRETPGLGATAWLCQPVATPNAPAPAMPAVALPMLRQLQQAGEVMCVDEDNYVKTYRLRGMR